MSVGRTWLLAPRTAAHRAAICRALKIDPTEPGATYATGPFTVLNVGGQNWIAGAVGIWRAFRPHDWQADDISDIILWNPRTGALQLLGDSGPALIVPFNPEPRLTVYADGAAFFRAWADSRAATLTAIRSAASLHRVTSAEPADGGLPGALAIGDLRKLPWTDLAATVLVAGSGIDARDLNRAVLRSARLPRIESLAA